MTFSFCFNVDNIVSTKTTVMTLVFITCYYTIMTLHIFEMFEMFGMFEMWNVHMWDVANVGFSGYVGCSGLGMFGMWYVCWDVGCWITKWQAFSRQACNRTCTRPYTRKSVQTCDKSHAQIKLDYTFLRHKCLYFIKICDSIIRA